MQQAENYQKVEVTEWAGNAHLLAMAATAPLLILLGTAFYLLHGDRVFMTYSYNQPLFIFAALFGGVVAHELLHGISWAFFCKNGFRSIRFGFMWKSLTPYCHCKEPLSLNPYLFGALVPGLVLGLFPAVFSLFNGSQVWLHWGLIFILSAGGDLLISWLKSAAGFTGLKSSFPSYNFPPPLFFSHNGALTVVSDLKITTVTRLTNHF